MPDCNGKSLEKPGQYLLKLTGSKNLNGLNANHPFIDIFNYFSVMVPKTDL